MPVQVALVECGESARNTHVPNPKTLPQSRVGSTPYMDSEPALRPLLSAPAQLSAGKGNFERSRVVGIHGSSAIPLRLADSSVVQAVIGKLDNTVTLIGERRAFGVRVQEVQAASNLCSVPFYAIMMLPRGRERFDIRPRF